MRQILSQPLYDTCRIATGAGQTVDYFSVKLNGILTGTTKKTLAETNLTTDGQLPSGYSYSANGINFAIREIASGATYITLADYRVIMGGFIEIKIGNKNYQTLPISCIPAGCLELGYFSNITAAATEFKMSHGAGVALNRFPLDVPIDIGPGENISVKLTIPGTIVAVVDATFMFHGQMARDI